MLRAINDEHNKYTDNIFFNVNQKNSFKNLTDVQCLINSSSDDDLEAHTKEIVSTMTLSKKQYIEQIKLNKGIMLIKDRTSNNSL